MLDYPRTCARRDLALHYAHVRTDICIISKKNRSPACSCIISARVALNQSAYSCMGATRRIRCCSWVWFDGALNKSPTWLASIVWSRCLRRSYESACASMELRGAARVHAKWSALEAQPRHVTPLMQIRAASVTEKPYPAIPNTADSSAHVNGHHGKFWNAAPPFACAACPRRVFAKGIPCGSACATEKVLWNVSTRQQVFTRRQSTGEPGKPWLPVAQRRGGFSFVL